MVNDGRTRYADDLTLQELVRLRVENERLREALKRIEQYDPLNPNWQAQIARAALKGDE